MGKKNQKSSLGRSIIRDRFGGRGHRSTAETHLHNSELADGYDWNRINLRSVTEETSLEEFLATAELAGTEFTAEKLNIKFVSQDSRSGLLSAEEERNVLRLQDEHRELLRIPRRPPWDEGTTAVELDQRERDSFLDWRRQLAKLQEVEGIVMTPFERNLDFWRQLWRVIERSDIVVQIVDARNPLLFRSVDLEKYVKEVGPMKMNMLLINKADYLTEKQREVWTSFFDKAGILVAFWSAALEKERLKEAEDEEVAEDDAEAEDDEDEDEEEEEEDSLSEHSVDEEDKDAETEKTDGVKGSDRVEGSDGVEGTVGVEESDGVDSHCVQCQELRHEEDDAVGKTSEESSTYGICDRVQGLSATDNETEICDTEDGTSSQCDGRSTRSSRVHFKDMEENQVKTVKNNSKVLTGPELIDLLKTLHTGPKYRQNTVTIGLVGYPNVGKSSTINALIQTKKVPVSATPGRTKHFQTLFLDPSLLLCDCPGLVMPTFVNTKADMVLNGILPIDQMRDYVPPVALLATLIPRGLLEAVYGIMIPRPREGEDEDRPPTAHELLGAYGYMRGYMTHKGIPDFQRSARSVLKDFVSGKLLYCKPPPGADITEFCPVCVPESKVKQRSHPQPAPIGNRSQAKKKVYTNDIDEAFFEKKASSLGTKGVSGGPSYNRQEGLVGNKMDSNAPRESSASLAGKPWKKHHNRGKKEKLRRIHSYLDA